MVNVGQLVRESAAATKGVVLVGFGSYRGSVIAGQGLGRPGRADGRPRRRERAGRTCCTGRAQEDKLLLLDPKGPFGGTRGHRAIGVVYQPEYEHLGNYVPTELPRRYDALLYIDETRALSPLPVALDDHEEIPETIPSGR